MKRTAWLSLSVLALALAAPTPSRASDHIDGMKTALDNAADITDVFAFASPKDPNKLVLAMNVHGVAYSGSRFSNAVEYTFRIRPIANPKTLTPSADPRDEQRIVCSFSGGFPVIAASQHATCAFELAGGTETVRFETRTPEHRAGGSAQQGDIRVFAGVRSDPWFLDLVKTVEFGAGKSIGKGPGINGLHGQNVLSIVIELDKRRLGGPLLAVTGQTVRK